MLVGGLARVQTGRIEQRGRLRAEQPLPGTTIVVRGGRDTLDKLRGMLSQPPGLAVFRMICQQSGQ